MFLRTGTNILQYASCVKVNIQLILTGYLPITTNINTNVLISTKKNSFRITIN